MKRFQFLWRFLTLKANRISKQNISNQELIHLLLYFLIGQWAWQSVYPSVGQYIWIRVYGQQRLHAYIGPFVQRFVCLYSVRCLPVNLFLLLPIPISSNFKLTHCRANHQTEKQNYFPTKTLFFGGFSHLLLPSVVGLNPEARKLFLFRWGVG